MKNTSYLTNIIDFGTRLISRPITFATLYRLRELGLRKPGYANVWYSSAPRSNGNGKGLTPLLTARQASAYVQCTPRFLQKMVSIGRLRALKPSLKMVRYRLSDLDAFLESSATIGGDQ
jgi:excisionase family DNA binding protein